MSRKASLNSIYHSFTKAQVTLSIHKFPGSQYICQANFKITHASNLRVYKVCRVQYSSAVMWDLVIKSAQESDSSLDPVFLQTLRGQLHGKHKVGRVARGRQSS